MLYIISHNFNFGNLCSEVEKIIFFCAKIDKPKTTKIFLRIRFLVDFKVNKMYRSLFVQNLLNRWLLTGKKCIYFLVTLMTVSGFAILNFPIKIF